MALSSEQQTRMWTMLNKTRGQISLTTYKDYFFGILFYKYLSERATRWLNSVLRSETWESVYSQDSVKALEYMKRNIGYAIQPNDFFADWKKAIDKDCFNIGLMTDTFDHFSQQIAFESKKGFEGIFDEMRFDSGNLGFNAQARASVMILMIELLSTPEFDLSGNNDIVSDIYEYLVTQFTTVLASDMGQYHTPKEISEAIARILTFGREDKESFSIYDPVVGSGSLLLTTASYMDNAHKRGMIKYFGQEKVATPYRLAKMNLMIHGVEYNDININHADTLKSDWPDGVIEGKDSPRMFDAIMANPPYSAHWNSEGREDDPRWSEYGVSPKAKADYAFLLHGLYHLEDDGRMAIVLPHGVLFRGAAEGRIRKALIDKHQIEAVIGLPDRLFLNTAIPVCIIVLKKHRIESDILFVDASKEFKENKKQNQLRPEDIDKIVETVMNKEKKENYSYVATLDEIKENNYSLNIRNYVDIYGFAKIVSEANFEYIRELEGSNKYIEAVFVAIMYKKLHKNLEIEEFVAELLEEEKLSQEQYDSDTVSNRSKLGNKLTWARSFLKNNNIIDNQKQGYWTLTKQGEKINSIYFDNKYFNDRFDSIDSFVFETLQVFNEDRKVYDIKFEQNQICFNDGLITKSILIGENGAGKSSILRAVSQVYLVLSKNQEVDVRINLKDLDHTKYDLKYRIGLDRFHVQLIKEKSNIKITCKKNNYEIPFSHLVFPKKMLAISTIVNDTYMFSSNDYYKYLGTRSSANSSFKGELDKSIGRYFSKITSKDREEYLTDVLKSLNISKLFIKDDQLFAKRNEASINFEYLSSGEKNYLNIFMAIISKADTSNLILIDEPESSLHPSWQVKFLSELERLLKKMGVISHVIIATHSHFLISDLSPENAYIIHCSKNKKHENVTQFIENDTYGWSAENVLYNIFGMRTTRNTYFLKDMDTMMTLVESQTEDMEQLESIIAKLSKYTLTKEDPLISLIEIAKDYYNEHKEDR
ncbi:type I restriction-modification system subunit M [uncultured Enterococcus sp.]|uniref:type I restriction-modification system subunit M n=1 Tax=uncultured Enterococcus sp. TaxID=167972 RepID=UPI002AA84A94|nr:type I restriction-modification system subunit M [uncultured Enterococcus sp.]